MVDYNFDCPHCGQNLDAPPSLAGFDVNCPACSKRITVPLEQPPKPPPPPPPPPVIPPVAEEKPADKAAPSATNERLTCVETQCPVCHAHLSIQLSADAHKAPPLPKEEPTPPKPPALPKEPVFAPPIAPILPAAPSWKPAPTADAFTPSGILDEPVSTDQYKKGTTVRIDLPEEFMKPEPTKRQIMIKRR